MFKFGLALVINVKLTRNHLNSIFLVGSTVYPAWCLCLSGSLMLCVRKEQTCFPPVEQSDMLRQTQTPSANWDSATALHLLRRTRCEPVCSPTLLFLLSVHTLDFQVREIILKVLCPSPDVPAVLCRVDLLVVSSCCWPLLLSVSRSLIIASVYRSSGRWTNFIN